MPAALSIDEMAIVFKGIVTPAALSPDWALRHNLVGSRELEDSDVQVISPDATDFSVGWLKVTATPDSLVLSTASPDATSPLRDAAVSALRALRDMPLIALGINRHAHFPISSVAEWHAIGDRLAPKELWSSVLDLPGTMAVTLRGVRPDHYAGHVTVQVEPSQRTRPGLYVLTNEHFDLRRVQAQPASREDFETEETSKHSYTFEEVVRDGQEKRRLTMEILEKEWNDCQRRSTKIIDRVYDMDTGRVL